jgi:hypothetical protein
MAQEYVAYHDTRVVSSNRIIDLISFLTTKILNHQPALVDWIIRDYD